MYRLFNSVVVFLALATLALSACVTGGGYGPRRDAEQPPRTLYEYYTSGASRPQPGAMPGLPQEGPFNQTPLPAEIPPSPEQPSLPPVKVGLLLPLSGPQAALGNAMLNAAQMALFDIGHNSFELLPRDSKGTADGAREAAQAVLQDGAQLILGPVFAEEVRAAKPLAGQAGIKMIAFSTDWTLAGGGTYIMGFLPFDQVDRITRYAARQNLKRVGVLAPDTDYGRAIASAYRQTAGRSGLDSSHITQFSSTANDLDTIVRKFALENQNPDAVVSRQPSFDAVLMPVAGGSAVAISDFLTQYNMPPGTVKRLGTGLFDDPGLAIEPSLAGAWFAAPSPRLRADFESRYLGNFGARAPRLATLAYDAAALAAVLAQRGLSTTGQPNFDQASITNPNGFVGIDGIFRFRPDGTVERGLAVLEFRQGHMEIVDDAPQTFQSAPMTGVSQ